MQACIYNYSPRKNLKFLKRKHSQQDKDDSQELGDKLTKQIKSEECITPLAHKYNYYVRQNLLFEQIEKEIDKPLQNNFEKLQKHLFDTPETPVIPEMPMSILDFVLG